MRIPHYIFVAFIMVYSCSMFGECTKGHKLYDLLRYHEAVIAYESCLEDTDKPEAKSVFQLANAYRIIDDYAKAAQWYKVGMKITSIEMKSSIGYIQMIHADGNIEKSQKVLDSLILKYPKNKDLILLRESLVPASTKDSFEIQKAFFNSDAADYASTMSRDKIIFSSSRPSGAKEDGFTGQNFSRLWQINKATDNASPIIFDLNQKAKYNIGAATFSSDGNTIYFTTNVYKADKKGLARLTIMKSNNINNVWQPAEECSFAKGTYNCVHATLSPNGQNIVFATDKSGNQYDLYITTMTKNGVWSQPKILPSSINSGGQDVFPVWIDHQVLVFSTDGHSKWAGLDLYKTKFINGQWIAPTQLPQPFNSPKDDYSLTSIDSTFSSGYFTSNRDDKNGNEDIYSFSKIEVKKCAVTVQLIDLVTNTTITTPYNVMVGNQPFAISYADRIGHISLFANETLSIKTSHQGMIFDTTFTVQSSCLADTTLIKWYFTSPNVIITGIVLDNNTKSPLTNTTITFTNNEDGSQTSVTTDQNGQFSNPVLKNQSFTLTAKKEGYFGEPIKLKPEDNPSDSKINLTKIQVNSTFVISNALYDFNKSEINDLAAVEMERLKDFMLQNPTVSIELNSHTDARGNDLANMRLSAKRAQSAVDYLVQRGVSASRLVSRGYGESKLLNHCGNGVSCSEEEHRINRRTEFKILQM